MPGGLLMFGGTNLAGTSVVDTTTLFVQSPAATLTAFGTGCPGPGGAVPSLTGAPGTQPQIGTTLRFRVGNLPVGLSLPVLILGLSNTMNTSPTYPLPVDLGFVGFPGCPQLVSIDSMTAVATLSQVQDFPLAIPLRVDLLGFTLHGQAIVMYVNGTGAVSNAVTAVVGV